MTCVVGDPWRLERRYLEQRRGLLEKFSRNFQTGSEICEWQQYYYKSRRAVRNGGTFLPCFVSFGNEGPILSESLQTWNDPCRTGFCHNSRPSDKLFLSAERATVCRPLTRPGDERKRCTWLPTMLLGQWPTSFWLDIIVTITEKARKLFQKPEHGSVLMEAQSDALRSFSIIFFSDG